MAANRDVSNICQICFVTRDIKKLMKHFSSLGVSPFRVYSMDTRAMEGVTYRGKPADYSIKVAWSQLGSWTLELIEPTRGENIYTEFLNSHGEGIHHLGMYVDDYQRACQTLAQKGYAQTQGGPIEGKDKTGRFDYFETEGDFGTALELLDMPNDIGEPEYVYPERKKQ
jgi:hypothetical protein